MKSTKNVTTEIRKDENDFVKYSDLAATCINVMPQGGLDVMQMKNRLNVMSQLDKANGTIKLEDAEAETLKTCVKEMKWAIMHKDVVSFVEAIEAM
jgi:hypothetical protein